jgi:hypothetical protein
MSNQHDYDGEIKTLSDQERNAAVEYLENHDKPRVAAPIAMGGFGSAAANCQLAPLQFLYSSGPVIIFNGQEVGELGAGFEGFDQDNGHTTFFDYWGMPEFAKWVNGHAYDGAGLSRDQIELRNFFTALCHLCQDHAIRGSGYWSLKYFNQNSRFADCPDDWYSFARFEPGSRRTLLVVTNFRPGNSLSGRIRVPLELANVVNLPAQLGVKLLLDRQGAHNQAIGSFSVNSLSTVGFPVTLLNQEAHVYSVE